MVTLTVLANTAGTAEHAIMATAAHESIPVLNSFIVSSSFVLTAKFSAAILLFDQELP